MEDRTQAKFQSRLGFSGRLDVGISDSSVSVSSRFNPVLGFLVVSTVRRVDTGMPRCFNPVLGFLVVSTLHVIEAVVICQVSIPSWVFWSSRPAKGRSAERTDAGFNPVLGFLVVSTDPWSVSHPVQCRFNPVLGFLVVSTIRDDKIELGYAEFQSRLGFSGRLDHTTDTVQTRIARFNPVLGFLVVSTPPDEPLELPSLPCFNPVLGFLVVSTRDLWEMSSDDSEVSIPSWVFWSSRLITASSETGVGKSFQSRLGFSGRLDLSDARY